MTKQEALDALRGDDLIGLGMEADALRRKYHPEGVASYIIDRNINHTNFCTEYCSFCAFYRPMGHEEGYVLPKEEIFAKIQETVDLGGTGVLMQGGVNPDLKIEYLRRPVPLDQGTVPDPPALLVGAGSLDGRRGKRNYDSRYDCPDARRRVGLDSGCRRGDSRRRSARQDRTPQVYDRGLDQRPPHGAPTRYADDGHDDVRLR